MMLNIIIQLFDFKYFIIIIIIFYNTIYILLHYNISIINTFLRLWIEWLARNKSFNTVCPTTIIKL